jgi:hypothetical protein
MEEHPAGEVSSLSMGVEMNPMEEKVPYPYGP